MDVLALESLLKNDPVLEGFSGNALPFFVKMLPPSVVRPLAFLRGMSELLKMRQANRHQDG